MKPTCTGEKAGLWLGATDITTEGTFVWENSGKPLAYTNWSNGEPNDLSHIENCLHMWCYFENGYWNDVPCDYKTFPQSTICEVIFPCN